MDIQEEPPVDKLDALANTTFRMWRLTPLLNFNEKTCDILLESLRCALETAQVAVAGKQNVLKPFDVFTMSLKYFTLKNWDAVDKQCRPLRLKVVTKRNTGELSTNEIYFMPATYKRPFLKGKKNTKDYPLALVRFSIEGLDAPVMSWLQDQFLCRAVHFHTSGTMMESLLNWWAESFVKTVKHYTPSADHRCGLHLVYATPVPELNQISLFISFEQLIKLKNLKGSQSTVEELIREHVFQALRLDVRRLVLEQVGTPIAYLSSKGQVKILNHCKSDTLSKDGLEEISNQQIELLSEMADIASITV